MYSSILVSPGWRCRGPPETLAISRRHWTTHMALKLLVDTSVWLDLAKDYRQQPVIAALEDLVAAGEIELIVPQVLLDEFARNKERVAIDATRSFSRISTSSGTP